MSRPDFYPPIVGNDGPWLAFSPFIGIDVIALGGVDGCATEPPLGT